jgi:transposase
MKPWQMVAAVSEEVGMEAAILYDTSINSKMFVQIYDEIAKHDKDFVLFGDNASWHSSIYSTNFLKERDSSMIFNLPYMPILNPIETVFLQIKTIFKRLKLNRYMNG